MKWEYKIALVPRLQNINNIDEFDGLLKLGNDTLQDLGSEGWELVSVDDGIAYLKREIKNVSGPYIKSVIATDNEDAQFETNVVKAIRKNLR